MFYHLTGPEMKMAYLSGFKIGHGLLSDRSRNEDGLLKWISDEIKKSSIVYYQKSQDANLVYFTGYQTRLDFEK